MHTVSITRMPSSRATIAAGTSPPRVIVTIASNGPAPLSRHASARESRWNWSHDTGKIFVGSMGRSGSSSCIGLFIVGAKAPSQRVDPIDYLPAGDHRRRYVPSKDFEIFALRILSERVKGVLGAAAV